MSDMSRFQEQTAVVTGAGSGIGAALAGHAVELGMNVVIADIDAARLEETRSGLAERGGTVAVVPTDVRDPEAVDRLSTAAYDTFGSVALLVNNAGIESVGHIWEMSPQSWRRVQEVNALGAFHGIRSFVPRMGADPRPSHVVNMSSVAAITSAPMNAAYCASKHAVLAMTECLYVECRQAFPQISVSVVCPAAVTTHIFDDALTDGAGADSNRELDTMRGHLRTDGIAPERAAEIIFDGIAAGDFWITTHPERFREIAARRASMLTTMEPPVANIAKQIQERRIQDRQAGEQTQQR